MLKNKINEENVGKQICIWNLYMSGYVRGNLCEVFVHIKKKSSFFSWLIY